jgi:hypothetical protein
LVILATSASSRRQNLSLETTPPWHAAQPPNSTVVLERLTEPLDEAPADEGGGEMEGLEDVDASLVSDSQPPEAAELLIPTEVARDSGMISPTVPI